LSRFRNCLAEYTVHSLSPCYGLLTALELLNSVAGWCNTTQFFTKMVFFYMLVCSGASSLEKGVCQLLISLFSIKPHFRLRLEIDWWILRCCQSII